MEVGGLKVKNKLFTKLSDISEIFNKHFSTIGYKLGQIFGRVIDADQFPLKTTETFRLTPVTEKFVYDQLLQLKPNKAIVLDKISSRLLKDGAEVIAPILAKIMNFSFNSTSFPQSWKSAKVMALFKNGSTDDCNNYRRISILPTISKIIERAA
jgi:potassium voltage-gated channel Eag-related subfamily H protein 8